MPTYIDPHIHMVSRTTDDYKRMAVAGCVMVSEPAFWAGFDRSGVEGFRDYFRQLVDFERKRAAQYGIAHYCWLCINAKEAEDVALSRQVIAMIPEFLDQPGVLGIGEIGLNKNTRNESIVFLEHVDLAMKTNEQILIHTPHLEEKYQGTRMILDMLSDDRRIDRGRVLVDHVEEHTIREVLESAVCMARLAMVELGVDEEQIDRTEQVYRDRDDERLKRQTESGDIRAGIEKIITRRPKLAPEPGECG